LGKLLRSEVAREDYGISEVLQLAGSSQWVLMEGDGDFSFSRRALAENREEGFDDSREMIRLERF
jgi:hypothetical protein